LVERRAFYLLNGSRNRGVRDAVAIDAAREWDEEVP